MLTVLFSAAVLALLCTGCDDRTYVNIYDKNITHTRIECLDFVVLPPDEKMEKFILSLYPFKKNCPYRLDISYKSRIHCNAAQNAARGAVGNFPSAYLRMELRRGMKLLYSYYIDLTRPAEKSDIKKGFERIRKDLSLGAGNSSL